MVEHHELEFRSMFLAVVTNSQKPQLLPKVCDLVLKDLTVDDICIHYVPKDSCAVNNSIIQYIYIYIYVLHVRIEWYHHSAVFI